MTKQKSGVDEKAGPTRARAAKFPAAARTPPAEENASPVEETISRAQEEQAAAFASPVVAEAVPEVATASAPESVEVPAQIVLLAGEAEAVVRDEPLAFSWSDRNLDFWKENAQALYRLAGELGVARTPGEIIEAQTKFATERLRAFGRHAEAMAKARVKLFFAA